MSLVRAAAAAGARGALQSLGPVGAAARVAVLPRAAAGPATRARLREAGIECVTTLEGGDLDDGWDLANELAAAQGWALAGEAPGPRARGAAPDVIGWYEVRIAHGGALVTADRPITRLHGTRGYIASFNLLGQGRLNARCARLLHRRLVEDAVVPGTAFDAVVCSETKAVGLVQELVGCFRLDRYVVLRKGVKNYMPRRPRSPLVQELASITTAGAQLLVLDPNDWPLVEGRRVLLVDDVIATGGTIQAASGLLERAGAQVVAVAALLLKGPAPRVPRLLVLARPLL